MRCSAFVASALTLASVSALASAQTATGYDLYYGDAGLCDFPGPDGGLAPGCREDPPATMWVQRASFDTAGKLLSKVNLTDPEMGIGYITMHPSGTSLLYASEEGGSDGDVNTFFLPFNGSAPSEFLRDIDALLPPCAQQNPPCVDASTFHATYSLDGQKVFFAYRAWDRFGNGIGAQSIGVANADGTGMTPLTYVLNIGIIDMW